jgi:transcription termination/antitermination protein NusG
MLFEVAESVKVVGGAFQDFEGTVEDVNPALGNVRVMVSLFGRPTPIEVDFAKVERA